MVEKGKLSDQVRVEMGFLWEKKNIFFDFYQIFSLKPLTASIRYVIIVLVKKQDSIL